MKLNKKEIVQVEGFDWNVEVTIETSDYSSIDDILVEGATQALEGVYHSNPEEFKVGSVVKMSFKKSNEYVKYGNTYILLCNASMFRLANDIRKNFMEKEKLDVSLQPIIID